MLPAGGKRPSWPNGSRGVSKAARSGLIAVPRTGHPETFTGTVSEETGPRSLASVSWLQAALSLRKDALAMTFNLALLMAVLSALMIYESEL